MKKTLCLISSGETEYSKIRLRFDLINVMFLDNPFLLTIYFHSFKVSF